MAPQVSQQFSNGGLHRLAAAEVADAAGQHLARGVDDVEVMAALDIDQALVAVGLLAAFNRQNHLGTRRFGRRVAGAGRQQDVVRDVVAHAEAEFGDRVGQMIDLVVGLEAHQPQVAAAEIGDAQQRGQPALQATDVVGVPDFSCGGGALAHRAGAVHRELGRLGQEARLVADQVASRRVKGRRHRARIVRKIFRDAGQQVIEQSVLAAGSGGGGLHRVQQRLDQIGWQLVRRRPGRVEIDNIDHAAHDLRGQHMRLGGGAEAEALGHFMQLISVDRQPQPCLRQQRQLIGHQLVEQQQKSLELQHLGQPQRGRLLAQPRLADAVQRREVALHRVPGRQRAAVAQAQCGCAGSCTCRNGRLDRQPGRFAQCRQSIGHGAGHVGDVPALHRQAAFAEHQSALVQRQTRQAAGQHSHPPGIGHRHGVGHHLGGVGVGSVVIALIAALERVDRQAAHRAQAGHIHRHAEHIGQVNLNRQGAGQQIGVVDEAVFQQRAVKDLGQGQTTGQHRRQIVIRHRWGQHLADVEQQLRGDLGHVSVGRQLQLGADRKILGAHRPHLDEVFAQIAGGFERAAHVGQHAVALDLRVDRIHELDAHAVEARQRHLFVLRVLGRRLAQRLAAQIGIQQHVGCDLDPGVFYPRQVDQ